MHAESYRPKQVYVLLQQYHLAYMYLRLLFITGKCGNCECIATWGRPTPRQSSSALITTPCQVWSRSAYQLPSYNVSTVDTLRYVVTLTFDSVTLIFDLWPWTFVVYHMWPDETMYPISTEFGEITQNKGHYAVEGHSRSPILVPIKVHVQLPVSV